MALTENDQGRIRDYLLGQLTHEEEQRIEERLMYEDDLLEELQISKGELIEEYRAGELGSKENQWFERHFLASNEGKERYALAIALDCLESPSTVPERRSWLESLRKLFTIPTWGFAAASVSVLVVIVGLWAVLRPAPQTSLAFTLTSSSAQRRPDENQIRRVVLSPNVGEVRISLTLPDSLPKASGYRVELDNGVSTNPVKVAGQNTNSIVVLVPAGEVPTGVYVLRLFATPQGGAEQQVPGDYRFIVE